MMMVFLKSPVLHEPFRTTGLLQTLVNKYIETSRMRLLNVSYSSISMDRVRRAADPAPQLPAFFVSHDPGGAPISFETVSGFSLNSDMSKRTRDSHSPEHKQNCR